MKSILVTLIVLFVAVGLSAVTDLINFDDTGNLSDLFNPDPSLVFTNTSVGGLNNTGSVNIPVPSNDIWTHKTGFTLPEVGQTATISAYFKNEGYNGVSGIGFSHANVNTFIGEQITNTSSLGMSFHGGGGFFFNSTVYSAVDWYSQSGDLVYGNWYKVVFNVHNQGSDVFDLDFQIWNSDAAGVVGTLFTTQSLTGLSNPTMAGLRTIYPYFANSRSRSSKVDNFYVEITEADPIEVVISTFPHTESFESATFPPEGWVAETTLGSEGFDLELETIDPENPTVYDTPYGDNWVRLGSNPEEVNSAVLWSPRIDFPAGNEFYQITLSGYVTNVTTNNNFSYIQVNRSANQGELGSMMGQIHNVGSSVGWYEQSIPLGFLGGTSQYISLLVSDYYDDINFDNIRIEVGSPWHPALPYPANNSTDLAVNTWFGWGYYMMRGGTYSLYLSTDNVNYTSEYQGIYDSIDSLAVRLEENTTYYWYIEASEYGNTQYSSVWSFSTVADAPSSYLLAESFEGAIYPPTGWEIRNNWGDPSIELVTNESENPTAYDTLYGNNYVCLPIKPDAPNNWSALVSPRIDFPAGDGYYKLKMSVYITNNTSSNIRISRLTAPWDGDSYDVGYVSNTSSTEPAGWYEYSCHLGFMGGTYQYIGISATSVLEEVRFDNIRIEATTPWMDLEPQDEATDVEVYTSFNWNNYYTSTITYSFYLSPDGVDYTLMYEGHSNGTSLSTPLDYDTTYYWYVVANEYGNTVTSPVWTFTTVTDTTPPVGDPIVDFPYLADFQVEDPLWYTVPVDKKATAGNLNASGQSISSLQQHISTMSKDREGLWVRTLEGAANYAWVLPAGMDGGLGSPFFHLIGGQTYEIKYNYRQSVITEPSASEGLFMVSSPEIAAGGLLDFNVEMTNADYALRMITVTPDVTADYMFGFIGYTTVGIYVDNFRITQNGDDLLTAAAPTVGGVSAPDPSPIYNTETLLPLDTDLSITNITGTPEITATVSWSPPLVGSQDTGLKLNLHSSASGLAGATVTFIHNLGYAPLSAAYRIVPNAFTTVYNPNDGSWTATQCVFTVPAGKADGDYEVILQLNEDQPLPVELSSFTAVATQQNYVQLNWITQSETGVIGYYIYRNNTNNLEGAQIVSNLISAYNTSQEHAYNYTDTEVQPGTWYYWIQNTDMNGQHGFHGSISVLIQEPGEGDTPVIPLITSMQNIYPNPFNPSTTIAFGLDKAEHVNIQIFNVKGQLIRNLVSETKSANSYRIVWNGIDDNGKALPSGIYYAKMTAGKYNATRKLVIMK